jgi:hypothetical protein
MRKTMTAHADAASAVGTATAKAIPKHRAAAGKSAKVLPAAVAVRLMTTMTMGVTVRRAVAATVDTAVGPAIPKATPKRHGADGKSAKVRRKGPGDDRMTTTIVRQALRVAAVAATARADKGTADGSAIPAATLRRPVVDGRVAINLVPGGFGGHPSEPIPKCERKKT